MPASNWEVRHSCVSAYYVAAKGAGTGANVYDDSLYTPELKEYFEARGAEVHTQRVHFNPLRPAPAAVAPVAR